MADIESATTEFVVCVMCEVPEVRDALGLALHDFKSLGHSGNVCRGHAGAEDKAAGVVLEEVHRGAVRCDESAQRAEALAEGAHDQVHLVCEAEVVCGAAAVTADDAESVGIVHQDVGVVLLCQGYDFRERGDVAFHRIHAVHRDKLRCRLRGDAELLLQAAHVVVRELEGLAQAKTRAVDDAGVIQGIQEHESVAEAEAAHHSQVGLETGAVSHCFVFADELRELFFKFKVYIQRAVQETGSRAARTVFLNSFYCGFLEPRIV